MTQQFDQDIIEINLEGRPGWLPLRSQDSNQRILRDDDCDRPMSSRLFGCAIVGSKSLANR